MNILLVDHTTIYRGILGQALENYKEFNLLFASTAQEALELSDRINIQFVIVAQHLPDSDGIDLVRKLRSTGKFLFEPMILLTSSPSARLNEAAQIAGVTEVFRKHDILELVNFLRRFLGVYCQLPGRILYIEDEASQRNVLEAQLREWGMQVDAYSNAEDAWVAYQENDYDIIITDIVLAGRMSGSRFVNRVRRMPGQKGDVLILALTAFDSPGRRIELFYLGIDDYVGKPIVLLELRARIQSLLSRKYAADRTRLILEATALGVMVVGETGNIQLFNPEAEKLFGYTEAEAQDRPLSALIVGAGDAAEQGMFERYLQSRDAGGKQSAHFEGVGIRINGTRFPLRVSISEIALLGGGRQFAIVARDMTDERLLAENLLRAKEVAEGASRLKSDFLANMSHEIRTPMNAIVGLSHLCLQTELTPRQQDYLGKVNVAAKSLMAIINDILDLSKIEAGRLEMECIPFALKEVQDKLSTMFYVQAQERGLELRFEVGPDVPPALKGDPLRLSQVLINLIGNALKFTEHGSVIVAVEKEMETGDEVVLRISVKDSGIGMSADQVDRLFRSFTQADASISRKYGGTGLGLAISKRLINMMDGDIWVDSVPDSGTRIYFNAHFGRFDGELPATDHGAVADASESAEEVLRGTYVLLVEDNEINQQVARELLERVGVSVAIAENGEEGLAMVQAETFDGVLMDLQMPVMDGITATREIRKLEKFRNLPIIAMTANAMTGDRDRCLAAGMNEHIGKPIDPPRLYAVLARHLRNKTVTSVAPGDSPVAAADSPLPPLAGIDTATGLQLMGQDRTLYLDILFKFADREKTFAAEMHDLLREVGARETAERRAHTLKGLAGSIGAMDLALAAKALESCMRESSDINACAEPLARVEAELNMVLAAIAGIEHLRPKSAVPTTNEALATLLPKAHAMLLGFNAEAAEPVGQICAMLEGGVWAERACRVRDLTARYDYEAALDELQRLASEIDSAGES